MRRVERVVYMAVEVSAAMKPWACAYEDAPGKPFRTVVARRSAAIRSLVVVAVRTFGSDPDIEANLSLRPGDCCRVAASRDGSHSQKSDSPHEFISQSTKLVSVTCRYEISARLVQTKDHVRAY